MRNGIQNSMKTISTCYPALPMHRMTGLGGNSVLIVTNSHSHHSKWYRSEFSVTYTSTLSSHLAVKNGQVRLHRRTAGGECSAARVGDLQALSGVVASVGAATAVKLQRGKKEGNDFSNLLNQEGFNRMTKHVKRKHAQQQSSSSSSNRFIEHDVSTRKLGPSSGIRPSFLNETSCSIKRLLEDACC